MPARPPIPFKKLHLGEWLSRLDRKPREVAEKVGIGEAYMSELISGAKKNPSAQVLLAISEEIGLTVNDLYKVPPSASAIKAAGDLSPSQIAALGQLLDQVRRTK